MNKKTYKAPEAQSFLVMAEGLIATSSIKIDDKTSGNSQLSNEMEQSWSDDIWSTNED